MFIEESKNNLIVTEKYVNFRHFYTSYQELKPKKSYFFSMFVLNKNVKKKDFYEVRFQMYKIPRYYGLIIRLTIILHNYKLKSKYHTSETLFDASTMFEDRDISSFGVIRMLNKAINKAPRRLFSYFQLGYLFEDIVQRNPY